MNKDCTLCHSVTGRDSHQQQILKVQSFVSDSLIVTLTSCLPSHHHLLSAPLLLLIQSDSLPCFIYATVLSHTRSVSHTLS